MLLLRNLRGKVSRNVDILIYLIVCMKEVYMNIKSFTSRARVVLSFLK